MNSVAWKRDETSRRGRRGTSRDPRKPPPPYCSASAIGLGRRACRCRRRPRRSHPHCHSLSLRAGRPSSSEGRFLSWDPSPGRPGQCSCRGGSRPRGPRRSAKETRASSALLPRPPRESSLRASATASGDQAQVKDTSDSLAEARRRGGWASPAEVVEALVRPLGAAVGASHAKRGSSERFCSGSAQSEAVPTTWDTTFE